LLQARDAVTLPFTPEQFFETFVQYNQRVWPMQLGLIAAALVCIVLVIRSSPVASRAISLVLSLLWAWMAIAYHFAFFTHINSAAWAFGTLFLAGSAAFGWFGVVKSQLHFRWARGVLATTSLTLIVFALVVHPLVSYLVGHRYPSAPTFGVPCPTTIFTLGLLLLAVPPVPRWVFVVPLLWAAIGSSAAFLLGVTEDLALLVAGALGIAGVLFHPAPADASPWLK
jgi:hypothetical protein